MERLNTPTLASLFFSIAFAIAGVAGAVPYSHVVLADNPVSYWRLGDAGSPAVDEVGVRNLSYQGVPLSGRPGAIAGDPDTATGFAGNSALGLAFDPALNTPQFSIESWVNIQGDGAGNIGGYQFFVASRETYWAGYSLGIQDDPTSDLLTWHFQLGQSDNTWNNAVYSENGPLSQVQNQWHHIVGAFDGSQARLFLNGLEVATTAFGGSLVLNTTGQFLVGGYSGVPLDGDVDEVAFYDYALSADRVAAHYQAGIGVIPEPNTALLLGLGLTALAVRRGE